MGKHLGLISIGLAVGLSLCSFAAWGVSLVLVVSNPTWGHQSDGSLLFTALGALSILTVVGYLVGLGLGIAGLIRREPRIYFAVLGTLANALVLLGVALLAVLSVLGASV